VARLGTAPHWSGLAPWRNLGHLISRRLTVGMGRRRPTPHARLATVRRLAVAQCAVSVSTVGLTLFWLIEQTVGGSTDAFGRYEAVCMAVSVWCGLAAWRDCSSGVSRLLDPRLLSVSVDYHLARAVVAGAAVMLLSWGAMRADDTKRRHIVALAVAMQALATLCVVSMFTLRNTFNHMLLSAGSHADSDVEGSDVECTSELSRCCSAHERRRLSQTLPRGWRLHAPHRQGRSGAWEPPNLPLLESHQPDTCLGMRVASLPTAPPCAHARCRCPGLSTLEEEMSPILSTPLPDDGSNPSAAHSPAHSSPRAAAQCNGDKQSSNESNSSERAGRSAVRAIRSLSFGSRPGRRLSRTPPSDPDSEADAGFSCSSRRAAPARVTVWDLRASMWVSAPAAESSSIIDVQRPPDGPCVPMAPLLPTKPSEPEPERVSIDSHEVRMHAELARCGSSCEDNMNQAPTESPL